MSFKEFCLRMRRKGHQRTSAREDTHSDAKKLHEAKTMVSSGPNDRTDDRKTYTPEKMDWSNPKYAEATSPHVPPYQPPVDTIPPSYQAYQPESDTEHPEFPEDAIKFALRASHPPQSTTAADVDKYERKQAERDQSQYYGSIRQGDQMHRGLDELRKFQEERMTEVCEQSGLTPEQIERRRRLN